MITKQMLKDVGVSQETIDLLDAYPTVFSRVKCQLSKSPRETWLHWIKWRLIWVFGIYEFKVDCDCGNKLRCIDGVKEYVYECNCGKIYSGTKKRIFK
jgi:hypothetical protein